MKCDYVVLMSHLVPCKITNILSIYHLTMRSVNYGVVCVLRIITTFSEFLRFFVHENGYNCVCISSRDATKIMMLTLKENDGRKMYLGKYLR